MTALCTCGERPRPASEALSESRRQAEIRARAAETKEEELREIRQKVAKNRARFPKELSDRFSELVWAVDAELNEWEFHTLISAIKRGKRLEQAGPRHFSCSSCSKSFRTLKELNTHLVLNGLEKRHRCAVHGRAVLPHHCPLCQQRLWPPLQYVQSHFLSEHDADVPTGICKTYLSEPGERTIKNGPDPCEVQGGRPESNRQKF
jgi:hypothetical protein